MNQKTLIILLAVGVAAYLIMRRSEKPQTAANAPGLLPGFENIEEQLLSQGGF